MSLRIILFVIVACCLLGLHSCDLIKMKKNGDANSQRKVVARVDNARLYADELKGIVPEKATADDSATRVNAYVNSWIRKQLLIKEALQSIKIDEADLERKVQDYRYSLISYQFLNHYIREHLSDSVNKTSIEEYYRSHPDNFILKQNIIKGSYIKVSKDAPRTKRIKELMFSTKEKEMTELKSYCLGFSAAFHLADSSWIEFDKIAVNSPLMDIPNKIQFLQTYNYYETSDANFLYFLKVDAYKIADNVSPLEFVRQDIKNIILNKRKVELAKKLEDEIYENAAKKNEFEVLGR
ncbi:MAG: peptidyl-prolyl cis-trans isomerase [Bacteroidetes bacterium]|nr:peptidyl-prolyl cis-trans isomerase [Bacteroidota bacterium]MBS1539114.1 peptidyl-prolyl cis-trans isomerase [Bacteroidota bacterium]